MLILLVCLTVLLATPIDSGKSINSSLQVSTHIYRQYNIGCMISLQEVDTCTNPPAHTKHKDVDGCNRNSNCS